MGEVSDIDSMAVARPDGGTVRVPVELAGRGYDILIGAGLIGEAGRLVAERLAAGAGLRSSPTPMSPVTILRGWKRRWGLPTCAVRWCWRPAKRPSRS